MKLPSRRARLPAPHLGELEVAILELAWQQPELTAQAAHTALAPRDITLSTVQSTVERLTRKGLLVRAKRGRAYAYRAAVSREALIASLLRALSDDLATGRLEPLLGAFLALLEEAAEDGKQGALRARLRAGLDGEHG
ncbi:MAG: BlaI/MecI/CopY family transcriptional regulator [Gammaproteobacteria bacterium]